MEVFLFLLLYVIVFVLLVLSVILRISAYLHEKERVRALKIADIDNMKGIDFEKYVCRLLEHQGYKAKLTGGSGDFGVDIIAQRGDLKYAIQVKRHTSKVNRRAISDAVAGKGHYGCNAALVVTNSYFTKDAITFAQSTKCELVNRDTLAKWILEFQKNE